jgi:hypothetical protein
VDLFGLVSPQRVIAGPAIGRAQHSCRDYQRVNVNVIVSVSAVVGGVAAAGDKLDV